MFIILTSLLKSEDFETLTGVFEYNKYINGDFEKKNKNIDEMSEYLNLVDFKPFENYFKYLNKAAEIPKDLINSKDVIDMQEYYINKADSVQSADTILNKMNVKEIYFFYFSYYLIQLELLNFHCITLVDSDYNDFKCVFLTYDQMKSMKGEMGKEITLNVKLIKEVNMLKTSFYFLKE